MLDIIGVHSRLVHVDWNMRALLAHNAIDASWDAPERHLALNVSCIICTVPDCSFERVS
jgi:hypothetical protein